MGDDVQSIALSDAELQSGKYSAETLARALGALHQDGLVVLKGVIPVEIIKKINSKMCADADELIRDPSQEYNHGIRSNILQRPPTTDPEYLSKDVYFNSFVLQLANAYLGHRPVWNWLTSNNALASTGGVRQPVHKDNSFEHPLFPYYFIANIPLCDFSAANGATEFWLGSHAHTTCRDQVVASSDADLRQYPFGKMGSPLPPVREEVKTKRRAERPPIQPSCGQGDVMIRDLRTWHAGMPNESAEHRVMLALGYQSPNHPSHFMRVHLPFSQRDFFLGESAGKDVEMRVQWYSSDEELARSKADTAFYTNPAYKE